MAIDKIKRAFIWLRVALRITDKTTLPGEILGEVRPTMDTFGWDRRSPESSGPGTGPQTETAQSALAGDSVLLSAVPQGVMRYVLSASCSTDDPAGNLTLSLQVRTSGLDIGVQPAVDNASQDPTEHALDHPILLQPGQQLICRSEPAAAIATRLRIAMQFVDLDLGEYMPAL